MLTERFGPRSTRMWDGGWADDGGGEGGLPQEYGEPGGSAM